MFISISEISVAITGLFAPLLLPPSLLHPVAAVLLAVRPGRPVHVLFAAVVFLIAPAPAPAAAVVFVLVPVPGLVLLFPVSDLTVVIVVYSTAPLLGSPFVVICISI